MVWPLVGKPRCCRRRASDALDPPTSSLLPWLGCLSLATASTLTRRSVDRDSIPQAALLADPNSSEYGHLQDSLRGTLSYAGWSSAVGAIAPAPPSAAAAHAGRRPAWSAVEGLDGRAFVAPAMLDAEECAGRAKAQTH